MARGLQGAERKEGYNILIIFLLMLLLNAVIFASMYVVVFKPFEVGKRDKGDSVGPVHKLENFIVDVGSIELRKMCKVEIALKLKDNKTLTEVQKREAEIRSTIINILRLNTIELLKKSNDTTALQNLITQELNQVLGEEKVKTTWFTDFIVD